MTTQAPNQYPQTVYYVQAQPGYQAPQAPEKSYNTYFLLTVFGGVFGLHHFYTGNIGKGLIYLFTGGLFCLGWFKDILTSRRDFNQEMASQGILSARHRN